MDSWGQFWCFIYSPLHLKQIYNHLKEYDFGQVFWIIVFLFKYSLGTRKKKKRQYELHEIYQNVPRHSLGVLLTMVLQYLCCVRFEECSLGQLRKPLVLLRAAVSLASQQPCRNEDPFSLLSAFQTSEHAVDQHQIRSHAEIWKWKLV